MAKTSKKTAAKTEAGLNQQQEKFCQLYINNDREVFGNGARCYMEVYGPEHLIIHKKPLGFLVAAALASRLLTKVKVIERINSLLEQGGFNDENVDKQHLFLINQHADLRTKMQAIKEYNALKERVKNKLELVLPKPILDAVRSHNSDPEGDEPSEED